MISILSALTLQTNVINSRFDQNGKKELCVWQGAELATKSSRRDFIP
jgi:hypothetical protein